MAPPDDPSGPKPQDNPAPPPKRPLRAPPPITAPPTPVWLSPVPELPDEAYGDFCAKFQGKYQIDLTQYKEKQMRRRINMMLSMYELSSYDALLQLMDDDPKVKTKFFDRLTINVSEFFRNTDRWEVIEKDVLGPMAREGRPIRIFCAGCSTGEEPYSLAIMAHDQGWQVTITAWDIDEDALQKARAGRYAARQVEHVSPKRLAKYFHPAGDTFALKDEVKRMVSFERHNLLTDALGGPYDLLLCRNVVIYFTEETKDKLFKRFVDALRPGGFLFVGSTERIATYHELGLKFFSPFIYLKKDA